MNIFTYSSTGDDHVQHSFGRDATHTTSTWDNNPYDLNTYLNDVLITHHGDNAGNDYYGNKTVAKALFARKYDAREKFNPQ